MATHRNREWAEHIDNYGLTTQRIAERLTRSPLPEQERLALACQLAQLGVRVCRFSEDVRRGNRPGSGQERSDPQPASTRVA